MKNVNTVNLRNNFHELIDSIDNEQLLVKFYDLIKSRVSTKEGALWSRLTYEEQQDLLSTLDESENPDYLKSNEEMKKKHGKWL
jgi:hypothetical protein